MRSVKSIFMKQLRDTFKNRAVLIQFLVFPIMAFVMTEMVAKSSDEIPNHVFVTMFAAMFAGMTPLTMISIAIAEDRERKSLRLLVMAGVRPYEYLLGAGGFVLAACALFSLVFSLIGGFQGAQLGIFLAALILGSATSALLGATIGIFSKNQQAATSLSMPVAMVFAFLPLLSQFDEGVRAVARVTYTQQMNELVNGFVESAEASTASPLTPFLIILANMAVLLTLFVVAYNKKGLRD